MLINETMFLSINNKFEKNSLLVIAFVLFLLLFIVNDQLWLYVYFTLWFAIIAFIQIVIYVKSKKVLNKLSTELRSIYALSLIAIVDVLIILFGVSASALPTEYWFIMYWNDLKLILLGLSIFIFFIIRLYILIIELRQKNEKNYFINLFRKFIWYKGYIKRIRNIKFSKKFIRVAYISLKFITVMLVIFCIFFQTLFIYPSVTGPLRHWKAETNAGELRKVVTDLTENSHTDYEKTRNIYNWFKKDAGNMYNIWGHPMLSGYDGDGRLVFGYDLPFYCILCMRIYGRDDPLWVLTSRAGACEEYALLFREMANAANLPVRSIHLYEGNHCWDEVFINGSWIIVDPSRFLFNGSKENYKREFNNPRYVFAEYPNPSRTKEDVTSTYSNMSYVNISTVDINNNPVPHIEIEIFSRNGDSGKNRTGLTILTNETGKYKLQIGGGTVIFESNDASRALYNLTIETYDEYQHYDLKIVMMPKTQQEEGSSLFIVVIGGIYFILFLIIINVRRRRIKKTYRISEESVKNHFKDRLFVKDYYNLGRKRLFGLSIIVFGIVFMTIFAIFLFYEYYPAKYIDFNNLTIYISMISLGFAVFIFGVTYTSNVDMALLTNDRFSDILNSFENDRIDLTQSNARGDLSKLYRTCWKCSRYMERAVELTQATKIQPYIQNYLYDQVVQLIWMSAIPWDHPIIRDNDIQHVVKICENALFLKIDQAKREELWAYISYLEDHILSSWDLAGYFFKLLPLI